MARRPNIRREAAALLADLMRAARKKLKFHDTEELPLDAATISASVSLLKLCEAYETATRDEKASDLEKLRQEFEAGRSVAARPAALVTPSPEELRRQYGLTDSAT